MTALFLLAALAPAAAPEGKFRDVTLEKPYAGYLEASPSLMEEAGPR
jgi:hypothetical protein